MFVPHSKSQLISGNSSGFTSRRIEGHEPEVVAELGAVMSECSAIATLAGRKLSRIGIESDTSSINTVAER